jgi:hypothetical protein
MLSLPLMLAGTQVAHVLAYRFVYPNAHVRLSELLSTGHNYMLGHTAYLPMVLGIFGALDLVAVGWVFAGSVRRSCQRPVPPWAFALLPLLSFTLQELLERWLAGASFPWWFVLQPTFRAGLLLQLPFALLAFVVARVLLRVAHRAGSAVRPAAPRPVLSHLAVAWLLPSIVAGRSHTPATAHTGRGPPLLHAAVSA